MIDPHEWFLVPTLEAKGRSLESARIRTIISNIEKMMEDFSRWSKVDDLVFRHETGVHIQMKRNAADDPFTPRSLQSRVAVWIDDLPPFRVRFENRSLIGDFHNEFKLQEAGPTIEKVGALAALCAN